MSCSPLDHHRLRGIRDRCIDPGERAHPLHSFSISLPITGEQELSIDSKRLLSNADVGTTCAQVSQELVIAGNCRKMLVSMSHAAVSKVLEELIQRPCHSR
jgi:hypothetical protein